MFGICAGITFAIQIIGFLFAYALRTEVFYDVLGGLNYLVLAVYTATVATATDSDQQQHTWSEDRRKVVCTVIFVLSRGWLLIFLTWRAHERGGDTRFDNVKDKFGLFLIYWLVQALWVILISLPMIFVNRSYVWKPIFSALDWISLTCFVIGLVIEVMADIQKSVWVKQGRIGGFCNIGIWKFSRHPNYFGEILQWWSCWIYAFSSGHGMSDIAWWFTILSPLFTMHILLNTSGTGIPQANNWKNLKRYYDSYPIQYASYRNSTSILLPMIGYKHIPLSLKRTIFLDLERWEYTPTKNTVITTHNNKSE